MGSPRTRIYYYYYCSSRKNLKQVEIFIQSKGVCVCVCVEGLAIVT